MESFFAVEQPAPDPNWTVPDATPAYASMGVGEIQARATEALGLLGEERCTVCPRLCKVPRLHDKPGLCAVGRHAIVASYFPHFGEENCLRGWRGSGTIFFSGCNLRCVFCQNFDISWELRGERATPGRLAGMMLELQDAGCHNVNFVTPEHVVPQILEAIPPAISGGLHLPIIYNTSSYDSLDSLRLMDGIVDVYMPDFKVWTREAARRYLRRPDYPDVARESVSEMNRQVGPLVFDESGLARRGLLLRHLVMPGMLEETEAILRFVAEELGPDTYVDLMAQYYPAGLVGRGPGGSRSGPAGADGKEIKDGYEEIDRHLWREEFERAVEIGRSFGLRRLDRRSVVHAAADLAPAPAG
ncbi:MAG: radical SAM protein [Actinomycetota bacterium]|nr:radical SAM protein [Actinomycetota bacterium]